ncbi:MAG: hypothetical protein Kow0069_19800 [Promethearchaeota archaeon]
MEVFAGGIVFNDRNQIVLRRTGGFWEIPHDAVEEGEEKETACLRAASGVSGAPLSDLRVADYVGLYREDSRVVYVYAVRHPGGRELREGARWVQLDRALDHLGSEGQKEVALAFAMRQGDFSGTEH